MDAVVNDLRSRILQFELSAGAPLREADLRDRYGVSRHSLRVAVQHLVHERLLVHKPHHGVFVVQLDDDDVRDLYRLRMALESEAARHASKAPDALARMEAACARLAALADRAELDPPQVMEADLDFHESLMRALGSERADELFATLRSEMLLVFARLAADFKDPRERAREHAELLERLRTGPPAAAAAAVRAHLEEGVEQVLARPLPGAGGSRREVAEVDR